MTPGLGQGANQGLEDAAELAFFLAPLLQSSTKNSNESIARALESCWQSRIERVKAIHGASTDQTARVNNATKHQPIYNGDIAGLFKDIYEWKPSLLSK